MAKNVCLQPYFKTVTIALFAFAACNIAWGQNPSQASIQVYVRVAFPKIGGGFDYVDEVVPSETCFHYRPGALSSGHSWTGYTTNKGSQLSHVRTGGLSYGFWRSVGGVMHQVTASDVDRFWEAAIYGGYDKISGASLSWNCHGHSTGVGYWLNAFKTLVDDDWAKYDRVGDLTSGAIYGDNGHSIRIDEVIITGTKYEVETSEKYRDSGVYARKISPTGGASGGASSEVALDLKIVKWNTADGWHSESVDPAIDHFYKK